MTTGVPVAKAHAYGNDFLLVAAAAVSGRDASALARAACDRHRGIGADGLIVYTATSDHLRMDLFNADGSPSELSGNGVRCLGAYALQRQLLPIRAEVSAVVRIETPAGRKVLELTDATEGRWTFRTAMGPPADVRRLELEVGEERREVVALSVGNPQCVLLDDLDSAHFHRLGPLLERHPAFPNRTNVSSVRIVAPDRLEILIWERGVGPTSSSGTGSCGAAAAAIAFGGVERSVQVMAPGGVQQVEWLADGLYLTGWAEVVLEGTWVAETASVEGPPLGNS